MRALERLAAWWLGPRLEELERRHREDLARGERVDRLQRDFVADVSHELRTPLAAIRACAETLARDPDAPAASRAEFLEEIEKNADRMSRLIDDLLELSALEAGGRPRLSEPVGIDRVAAAAAAAVRPLAEKKGIALRVDPFGTLPPVSGDSGELKRALINLLDNAVKFTPEGGTVRLGAREAQGRVLCRVEDTGTGIGAEHLPRLFDRFYTADKARSRESGGTGLGLAIVKSIVERHGGRVSVESEPGKGSAFTVELPAP